MNQLVIDVYTELGYYSHPYCVTILNHTNFKIYDFEFELAIKYSKGKQIRFDRVWDCTYFYFININDAIKFAIFNRGIHHKYLNCLKYI